MKRILLCWVLPLTLLAVLFGFISLRSATEEDPAPLSVVMLCEEEGDALLLHSEGETWVLVDSEQTDEAQLSRHLDEIGVDQIDLLCYTGDAATLTPITSAFEVRKAVTVEAHSAPLRLGDTHLHLADAPDGPLTLTVRHGAHDIVFLLAEDSNTIRVSSAEGVETIEADEHSVSILLDENGVSCRPDFSAWYY